MSSDANSIEILNEPGVSSSWALHVHRFLGREASKQPETERHPTMTTLAIEQTIAADIEQFGTEVARVVHSFGGRDIHLRDGSRVEYRWQLVVSDWRCLDCTVDTDALGEYYMLHDDLWERIHPDKLGKFCIACVERRLGRELVAPDFTDVKINTDAGLFYRSPRLTDRLAREASVSHDERRPS